MVVVASSRGIVLDVLGEVLLGVRAVLERVIIERPRRQDTAHQDGHPASAWEQINCGSHQAISSRSLRARSEHLHIQPKPTHKEPSRTGGNLHAAIDEDVHLRVLQGLAKGGDDRANEGHDCGLE
jgi:hypothetical protein